MDERLGLPHFFVLPSLAGFDTWMPKKRSRAYFSAARRLFRRWSTPRYCQDAEVVQLRFAARNAGCGRACRLRRFSRDGCDRTGFPRTVAVPSVRTCTQRTVPLAAGL